jgi:hypothetical protein
MASLKAMNDLLKAVAAANKSAKAGIDVAKAMEKLAKFSKVLGVIGDIFGFIDLFMPDEDALILAEIKKLEGQIASLRTEMETYFKKVINAEEQDTCFASLM